MMSISDAGRPPDVPLSESETVLPVILRDRGDSEQRRYSGVDWESDTL